MTVIGRRVVRGAATAPGDEGRTTGRLPGTASSPRAPVRARALALAVAALAASCGRPSAEIFGELGHAPNETSRLSVQGESVYYCNTSVILRMDVFDPRNPFSRLAVDSPTDCLRGLVVRGKRAYTLSTEYLSFSPLSTDDVGWVVELPDAGAFSASMMVALSDNTLVIGRSGVEDVGDLLFIEPTGPTITRRIMEPRGDVRHLAAWGTHLVHDAVNDIDAHPEVVVRDLTAVTDTSLGAVRITLAESPEGAQVSSLAMRGQDLLVTGGVHAPVTAHFTGWAAWHRFDSAFSSTELAWSGVDDQNGVVERIAGVVPALLDEYAIFPYSAFDGPDKTIIFRLDLSAGLVEHRRLRSRDYVGRVAADENRRLLFVGGDAFQVFDLRAVTTGEPAW